MKIKLTLLLALMLFSLSGMAQKPVKWEVSVIDGHTPNPSIKAVAHIDPWYRLYAPSNPQGGVNPLEFRIYNTKGVTLVGKFVADRHYETEFDDIWGVDQYYYTGTVVFTQRLHATQINWGLDLDIVGQVCNDTGCYNISDTFEFNGKNPKVQRNYSQPAPNGGNGKGKSLPPAGTDPIDWEVSLIYRDSPNPMIVAVARIKPDFYLYTNTDQEYPIDFQIVKAEGVEPEGEFEPTPTLSRIHDTVSDLYRYSPHGGVVVYVQKLREIEPDWTFEFKVTGKALYDNSIYPIKGRFIVKDGQYSASQNLLQ